MNMKRGEMIFLIGVVVILYISLLIGFVSAQGEVNNCLSQNDIILKLYQSNNSHASNASDGNYQYSICHSDIFGVQGNGNRVCNGNNKVIGLYQENNSHAEVPEQNNYNIDVCYDDLNCRSVNTSTGDCNFVGGERAVLRLFQENNSHVSNASDNNYEIKICCSSCVPNCLGKVCGDNGCGGSCGTCPAGETCVSGQCSPLVGVPYWADMNENMINKTDLKDSVKLIAMGGGLPGKTLNYTVIKENFWIWPDYEVFQGSSAKEFAVWQAGLKENGEYESGKYYFEVEIEGSVHSTLDNSNPDYRYLIVTDTEHNLPPVANITNPMEGEVYLKINPVSFNQSSYDIDDFFDYKWELGDGNIKEGSTRDPNLLNYNFTHTYASDGQMNIKLIVTDERTLSDSERVSILVIDDGDYVFAGIKKPEWEKEIVVSGDRRVDFDASTTFAVNITGVTVNCLGGNCPLTLANGNPVTDPQNKRGNFSMFNFSWVFSDGESYNEIGVNGSIFKKEFGTSDWHTADLTVSLITNPSASSSAETRFLILYNKTCSNDREIFWDENGIAHRTRLEEAMFCLGDDFNAGTEDDCCPTGYSCNSNQFAIPGCEVDDVVAEWCVDNGINVCDDYSNSDDCERDNCSVGGAGEEVCGEASLCSEGPLNFINRCHTSKCRWSSSGKCEKVEELTDTITVPGETSSTSECVYDITSSDCIEGVMTVDQTGTITWNETIINEVQAYLNGQGDARTPEVFLQEECDLQSICPSVSGEVRICGANVTKLPFFTSFQLIITVFIIITIYIIIALKKQK
jgi:hypothetical protein